MAKDTSKLVEELSLCEDFATFYEENEPAMTTAPLTALLQQLLTDKKLNKAVVIRESELAEIYAYQIFSGLRKPDRKKLLCLAVAMHLTADETQTLLKSSGYPPLYIKRPFDSVVLYGFYKQLTVLEINELLFEYRLETLG